ncbi:hypothetical protein QVD17_37683 [Tagetes erecta]|uniref:Uncharacterized protein n=1 Tax=Tagetes erecta TaxID=13708 RepID=A0AAD8NIL0_TARER|nr:hypothetical protein QVD17_37683 [Tagetes erecta]
MLYADDGTLKRLPYLNHGMQHCLSLSVFYIASEFESALVTTVYLYLQCIKFARKGANKIRKVNLRLLRCRRSIVSLSFCSIVGS